MAIEKFRFVSPGVQVNEIDDSILPAAVPAEGPVVIGNTAKGPAMQPVMVSSIAELERVFGAASNGNVGTTDVWRTGASTSPTLATYAAKAFLQNAAPVTVVRLAGVPQKAGQSGDAGWQTDTVYQLFGVSGSKASLIANIYADSALTIELENGDISSSVSDQTFSLFIDGAEKKLSLNTAKQSFIRNVLNTNPARYSDTSVAYFLGETFENSTGSIPGFNKVYLTSDNTFADFTTIDGAESAESPVVVDDLVSGSNTYNELFKFIGLNNGSQLSKDIKVSIENVKASKNLAVTKYGTFDVVIRKLFETNSQNVLERFSGLSLDPTADNFIAKAMGDAYREWDVNTGRYVEYGTYSNKSAFVRVEMLATDAPATALPHGFKMRGVPEFDLTLDGLTGSHPNISLFQESVALSAAKTKRFGLLSDIVKNSDLVDVLSKKPSDAIISDDVLFHTRFISSSANSVQYVSGTYYNNYDILLGGVSVSGSVLGFDMPMYSGFDAKNITIPEAFVSDYVLSTGNEDTNAAYRAIKQAIDMVAEPETLDMNILCVPGLQNEELTSHMLEVCKLRGDSLALIDLKGDYRYAHDMNSGVEDRPNSVTSVVENLESRQIDNSYGAAYFPAVFVPTEGIFMPASIAALGALGGTEGRQALWFAPAGFSRGGLNVNSAGLAVSRTSLHLISSDRDALYNININPIATFPNEGVVIFGQKTLQTTPSALDRVNVRRLVNYIKKQISRAATRVLFEPNVEATWSNFKSVVDPFLLAIKNGYGLDDAKIVLDETTTTADLIDRNIMYCKIYIRPTRAIEYIAIDFVVTNAGSAFSE